MSSLSGPHRREQPRAGEHPDPGQVEHRLALPAVVDVLADAAVVDVAQRVLLLGGQRRQVGGRGVAAGLLGVARAGDDGGDAGLVDEPAQRELRGRRALAG